MVGHFGPQSCEPYTVAHWNFGSFTFFRRWPVILNMYIRFMYFHSLA